MWRQIYIYFKSLFRYRFSNFKHFTVVFSVDKANNMKPELLPLSCDFFKLETNSKWVKDECVLGMKTHTTMETIDLNINFMCHKLQANGLGIANV